MADIFFTYAPADSGRARAIAEALKAYGLDVAWDRTLLPGERYDAVVNRRLAEAKAVVVLWSNNSVGSSLIMDEAAVARDQGKLLPVRIDPVDTPLGFRQLQTADLAGWPDAPGAAHGLQSLAEALAAAQGAQITQPPPSAWAKPEAPAARAKLLTADFWFWTSAFSLFCGLLYFISPAGKEVMDAEVAGRIGNLIGMVLMAFIVFVLARVLIFFSRRFVGKPVGSYFTIEMAVFSVVAVLMALVNINNPEAVAASGTGLLGFTHQLNLSALAAFSFGPPIVFIVRGLLRLIRGAPRTN